MNHQQRVELYRQYMAAEGARMDAAAPPVWGLLWAKGVELPPPPFLGAVALGLLFAPLSAIVPVLLWGLDHLRLRGHHHMPWSVALWLAAGMAVFGLIVMPAYYRRMAKQHGLANWSTFRGVRQRT